jgi:hypothetical protein
MVSSLWDKNLEVFGSQTAPAPLTHAMYLYNYNAMPSPKTHSKMKLLKNQTFLV